jgi:hypothetical protein
MDKKIKSQVLLWAGLMAMALFMVALMAGCQSSQKQPVWGKGDPPADWQANFGNGNLARIVFVQTQTINNQGAAIKDLKARVEKLEEHTGMPKPAEETVELSQAVEE